VISDSCFSGTVTRAIVSKVLPGPRKTPDDRRVRFLSPALRGGTMLPNPWKAQPKGPKYTESKMREVLLSGCTDKEYSYDALIGDIYHGAMTYYALQAIRQANTRSPTPNCTAGWPICSMKRGILNILRWRGEASIKSGKFLREARNPMRQQRISDCTAVSNPGVVGKQAVMLTSDIDAGHLHTRGA